MRTAMAGAAGLLSVLSMGACTGGDPAALVEVPEQSVEETRSTSKKPAARTGDIGQEDLPAPGQLGDGWGYRVDHGNAEDGYVGSGEPATARDPAEVLGAITPLGCRPGQLPVPTHALEVTYARDDQPAVGMLLRFDDEATAAQFFDAHTGVISDCVGRHSVDLAVVRAEPGAFISTRTEQLGQTPTWVEGVALRDTEVLLVAVADDGASGVRAVESALR
jgi:hypothetical protein